MFCATDAGPANYLIPIIQKVNYPYVVYASSVTESIFQKAGIKTMCCNDFCEKLEIKLVVLGTTLGNTLENKLLELSKLKGFKAISVIEHWTNYKERFCKNGKYLFPEYIFVNDFWAKEQAISQGIPSKLIEVVGNPVLENQQKNYKAHTLKNKSNKFLFISERLDADMPVVGSRCLGYNQYDVLNDIVGYLKQDQELHIKLHPTDSIENYSDYLENYNVNVMPADAMWKQLYDYQVIIGMESMLLLEMAAQGVSVYSYRPNSNRSFVGCEMRWVSEIDKVKLESLIKIGPGESRSTLVVPSFLGSLNYIEKIIRNLYENSCLNSGSAVINKTTR